MFPSLPFHFSNSSLCQFYLATFFKFPPDFFHDSPFPISPSFCLFVFIPLYLFFNLLSNTSTKIRISRSKRMILIRFQVHERSQKQRTKKTKSKVLCNGTSLYSFIKPNSSMNLKFDTFILIFSPARHAQS